jgi:hypothetical protein
MKKILFLIPVFVLVVLMVGCAPTNPYFEKDKVKAEPTFITPTNTQHNQLTLHYTIKNPTNMDFNGKVSYKYNEDCLSLINKQTSVPIPTGRDDAYSVTVSANMPYRETYDEKCYGTQNILLVLSNNEGTIVYDSQNVEISVTR